MVNRRQIREVVMQILYAHDISKEDILKIAKDLLPESILSVDKSKEFAYALIDGVMQNRKVIDERIVAHADNWELERMAIIDRNLMRIALAEMMLFDDVPPKVSINEAIEIAKKYSTDKSSRFVNGILDAALVEMKKKSELHKTGRGLVDAPAKHPKEQPKPVPIDAPPPELQAAKAQAHQANHQGQSEKQTGGGNKNFSGDKKTQGKPRPKNFSSQDNRKQK
jgi:transcription antitermination protein NusB